MFKNIFLFLIINLNVINQFALPILSNGNGNINLFDNILKQMPNDFVSSNLVKNDYINLNKTDIFNSGQLKLFLTLKIMQKLDIINLYPSRFITDDMTEFSNLTIYDNLNVDTNNQLKEEECSNSNIILNKIASRKKLSICPWHWVDVIRSDRFPYVRSFAECSCKDCLANTNYDIPNRRLSKCRPFYMHMPVLVREYANNDVERWKFGLEKVSNSCTCSIQFRIN
jgi:hypothetical protein